MWCNRFGSGRQEFAWGEVGLARLAFVLAASLPIIAIRLADVRRWVAPAGPADFWLRLEAVISTPVLALLGFTLVPERLEARGITRSR